MTAFNLNSQSAKDIVGTSNGRNEFKLETNLVCVTLLLNGSNFTTILLAAFRLTCFSCFPIAETTPPDLRRVPL